jgi:hypothetical protein
MADAMRTKLAKALAEADGIRAWDDLNVEGFVGSPRFVNKDYWLKQADAALTALQVTEGDKRDIIFGILARRAFNEELLGHVIEATDEICAALHSNQEGEG